MDIEPTKRFNGQLYRIATVLGKPSLFEDKWKAESRAKSLRVMGWLARVVWVGGHIKRYVIYIMEK
jgi:hypothetical protein